MICWGISDLTIKPLAKKFGTLNATVYKFLPHLLFLFIYFLVKGFFIPTDLITWILLISFGMVGAVGLLAFVKSIETGLISINVAIAHACVVITAILSAIFLGEILGFYQYLVIFVILIGLFLLTFDSKSIINFNFKKFNSGAKYAYVTVLSWGIIYTLLKPIINRIGTHASTFYPDFFVIMIIFVIFLRKSFNLNEIKTKVLTKNNILLLLLASVSSFLAVVFVIISFSMEKIAISMGIITAAPLVTTVLAMIFFKERITKLQCFAIILIMISIISLAYLGG